MAATIPIKNITEPYVVEDNERHTFLVNRRAFVDPNVLAQEQAAIFDKCWLYIGHESEIPNNEDFLTRAVGGRELIFVRGKDGTARAFFNTCPHRGAMVCREKKGKGKMFRCFYHAWTFDLEGKLIQRPEAERYSEAAQEGMHNLVQVAKLEQYRGLYFVNFDDAAIDLVTYLAGAVEYIDLTIDHSEVAMEIVGGMQEYGFQANWKLLAENSFDAYHGLSTHATYFDYVVAAGGQFGETLTATAEPTDLGNGHAVIEYGAPWGRPIAKPVAAWGDEGAAECAEIHKRLEERFGKERADRIANNNFNMVIFPNFVINNIMAITLRTFFPEAPDHQHVKAWTLAPADESASMRERRLYNFLEFLGPGGFATPDDCEALKLCQKGYTNLTNAGWNDISKGMGQDPIISNDEEQMRIFWREWDRRIAGMSS
ncbi:MAG: Rieske 2Fe-2S domain-containing protein [Gammaproteobacteria bacterium]|jgi:p-cumate 2,3-dioxygenase alpha subunit|nr:Rieske 2Fe-2S domain-containing protein [Gammaproteobacteria bacterium]MBT3710480.1 Rieske 2Fe-2S domain-containing protein [Gammaproteobacteria bacterium]MBT3736085.1 Rieske 2Fe-2S domain-containing protein [Gammaproteobacteria bacterium]MBT3901042.1 Rieske 2Fe-2S domain-containing protein [Gammaproteobacteria bacterium]MBT7540022.1 Rieske 2Fe-2S domain-containing protein [Gammaproteobacteria bacterium]